MRLLSLLACLSCSIGTAQATIITIDPSNYAPGTDVSNATPGVTLSASSWKYAWFNPAVDALTLTPITVATATTGVFTGEAVFGGSVRAGAGPDAAGFGDIRYATEAIGLIRTGGEGAVNTFSVLRADFDAATNFVQLILGGGSEDQGWVAAYDAGGNMIGDCRAFSCAQRLTPGVSDPFRAASLYTIDTGANNIAFLVAGGGLGVKYVRSLAFDSATVPEPATVGLLVLGLLGIGMRRSKAGTRSPAAMNRHSELLEPNP